MRRLYNRFKFALEKMLLRGAHYQLLLIAIIIAGVSLTAGYLVYTRTAGFAAFSDAAWWAFLRLSDPGYLGDDEGLFLQVVSTVVTVLGYVLFLGALIAIMTQWLHGTMRRLELGLTPISQNDHFLILGWTNRTSSIVRELVSSEGKVKRFLRRIGARRLRIVILSEEVTTELHLELKASLGTLWNERLITFRSGSSLRADHLNRVDFMHAGVIILPGSDSSTDDIDRVDGAELLDTRTIKSLLTMANYREEHTAERQPLVVAELIDGRKGDIARTAYGSSIELVASDQVISRLMAQNIRHAGLSWVYAELLTHSLGNAIYVREWPRLTGTCIHDLADAFPDAIVLGVLREVNGSLRPVLNPPTGFMLEQSDRIVFLSRAWADTEPAASIVPKQQTRTASSSVAAPPAQKRLLMLGWNHKVPALVRELHSYDNEEWDIDILSLVPAEERDVYMTRHGLASDTGRVRHIEGDYTSTADLQRVHPERYDNILFLANNWLSSYEESDARTILGNLVMRELLPTESPRPEILVELLDPDNRALFSRTRAEVLISSEIISHMIAHVALRHELSDVFEELFTAGGAEISFQPAGFYRFPRTEMTFHEAGAHISSQGDILLGYRSMPRANGDSGGMYLNPPHDETLVLNDSTRLLVLKTYPQAHGSIG